MSNPVALLSPFISKEYKTNKDLTSNYHKQIATFLEAAYNYEYTSILSLVKAVFRPEVNGFKEAKFKVFKKDKHGDRQAVLLNARDFFKEVEQKNYHLSPSLVAYKNANEEESVNAFGTSQFINKRREYVGYRQAAVRGTPEHKAFNEIQNVLKIFNNAQSGGFSSSGTPLNNKSAHTSLTSLCRSLTSTANILNERLITGNRLLLTYNKTMELFVSTLTFSRKEDIKAVIEKYEMDYATNEQVMDMVKRCSNYYHRDTVGVRTVEQFVKSISPLDRTILLCTLDLRGLYTTNPKLMTKFIGEWSKIPKFPDNLKEEDGLVPDNGDRKILCVTKLGKDGTQAQINYLNKYHVWVENKWSDFISAFLKAEIPPSSVFSIKEMVRESVLTSDTDSSIYSVDLIAKDFVTDEISGITFNGVVTYFIRCVAVDQHKRLSKNINVSSKYLGRNNMKNEYLFGSYVTTDMSKHYYALQLMVEGVLNKEMELECKGVHLRGIKIALKVRELSNKLMVDVLNTIYKRETLDAPTLLKEIGDVERALISDLKEGGWSWLGKATIKDGEVYTNPESSVFFYHELWQKAFAPKYGDAPELPYRAFKVRLDTTTKGKLKTFIEGLEDEEFKKSFEGATSTRDGLSMMYIPEDMIESMGGVPKEVLSVVDVREILAENLASVYTILKSLGLFITNKKITRIVSDEH